MIQLVRKIAVATVFLVLAAPQLMAEDLTSAANDLCEKVKACSMSQIAEADMTPEMKQMMEPMLDSMCETMQAGVKEVPTGHELYQPAVACMRSMADLSCADFQDESKVQTPACMKYQEMAEKAYDDSQ